MKKAFLLTIGCCFVLSTGYSQQVINGISLRVSNVCEPYGQITGCNPPSGSGASANFGNGGCIGQSAYTLLDSIELPGPMTYFNIDPDQSINTTPKYLCAGDASKLLLYTTYISTQNICDAITAPADTFLLDSIVNAIPTVNLLCIIRSSAITDNFIVFQPPSQVPLFSMTLNMKPGLLAVNFQTAAVAGTDTTGTVRLNTIDLSTGLVTHDTLLGPPADNPVRIENNGTVTIASSPGDTLITATTYNLNTQAISYSTIYANSGFNTGDFQFGYFHYQPLTDPNGNNDDKKVFVYDLFSMTPYNTFNINRRLKHLIFTSSNYGYYMHGVEEPPLDNHVLVYNYFNYQPADSFYTPGPADFIVSDFRCFVSTPEYDDDLVKLKVYPNPTNGMVNVEASGLICGRDYKMELMDNMGKIIVAETIHAKMYLEIPMKELPAGVYFLRIETRRGPVSEKIVKM
ncbi:MAG TPA: T9SS type A sorting domain-containing protein [Bacteroidia bacterium]|nr:T9SS type A sorting domain-containing protein [Bacteroidia bacterium]